MSESNIPDWAQSLRPVVPAPPTPALAPVSKGRPGRPPIVRDEAPDDDAIQPGDEKILWIDGCPFPRVAARRIRAMSHEQRVQWDSDRLRAKSDPLYLSEILGSDLVENPHRMLFAQFTPMRPGTPLAELDPVIKRRMVLWSRGHGKTVGLRVAMVQTILNYPNYRLCFLTGGDALAKLQLAALKQVFEEPKQKFLELFPEFCLTSHQNKKTLEWSDSLDELGTQHEFTVPCRTNTVFAEPTFKISTIKMVKAGGHFDFLFADDLVNETNVDSPKALEKTYKAFLKLVPLLEPTGYLVVTGTRYYFGDPYEVIIEQSKAAGEASLWHFSIRDCWSTGCKTCGRPDVFHNRSVNILQPPGMPGYECAGFVSDGVRAPLFPQVKTRDGRLFGFTLDILDKIKVDIGDDEFSKQYENNPLATSLQTFTETMIGAQTLHDPSQVPSYFASQTFAVGDLADSTNPERDSSVIYLCRKFQGQIFVFDCRFGRWGSAQLVDEIIKVLTDPNGRPSTLFLEKTLGSDHLNNLITARANQRGLPKVPIQWIAAGNRKGSKALRIGNIQEALKSRRLFLFAFMNGYQKLVEQLVKWPRVKHDDMADCLGRVLECPTGFEMEVPPQPQSVPNWLQKFHGAAPVDDEYPDCGMGSGLVG
jgi:hypothetical protein